MVDDAIPYTRSWKWKLMKSQRMVCPVVGYALPNRCRYRVRYVRRQIGRCVYRIVRHVPNIARYPPMEGRAYSGWFIAAHALCQSFAHQSARRIVTAEGNATDVLLQRPTPVITFTAGIIAPLWSPFAYSNGRQESRRKEIAA